jgi:hypothetical protein
MGHDTTAASEHRMYPDGRLLVPRLSPAETDLFVQSRSVAGNAQEITLCVNPSILTAHEAIS